MSFFTEQLQAIRAKNLYRQNLTYNPVDAAHVLIENKRYVLLASNNYLGLTHHPRVKAAAIQAISDYGTGSGGARLTTGSHLGFAFLEKEIATFKQTEAAIVFNTGYMANLGTISALMNKDDVIFSDALNHASIIDGCRLSGAKCMVYPHLDMEALEKQLIHTACCGKRLIVSDGVFSMDGDIVPLDEVVRLAEKYQALVMVDDAHATGVLGGGRGTVAHFGLEDKVDIQMGTLSKALGAEGAYVAGSQALIAYLINRARSYIFSTALSPATIAAARAALHEVTTNPSLVKKLLENARFMRSALQAQGIAVENAETPIIPILIGRAEAAVKVAAKLKEAGIIVSAIRPPTVEVGKSRLRLAISAVHEKTELAQAAEEIAIVLQQMEGKI